MHETVWLPTLVLHLTLGASWGYEVDMLKSNTKFPTLQQRSCQST